MPNNDQELVEMVVKAIVANPDAVSTERSVDERGVLITLKVDPADIHFQFQQGEIPDKGQRNEPEKEDMRRKDHSLLLGSCCSEAVQF